MINVIFLCCSIFYIIIKPFLREKKGKAYLFTHFPNYCFFIEDLKKFICVIKKVTRWLNVGVQQERGKRNLQRHNFLVCFPNSVSSGSSLSFTLLLVNLATRTGLLPRPRPNSLGNNTVSDSLLRTRNPRPVSWNKTG